MGLRLLDPDEAAIIPLRPRYWAGGYDARLAVSRDGAGVLDRFGLSREEAADKWIDCCDEELRTYHPGLGLMVRVAGRAGQRLEAFPSERPLAFTVAEAVDALSAGGWYASQIALLRGASWGAIRRAHHALSTVHLSQARGLAAVLAGESGSVRLELHCDGTAAGDDPHRVADALTALAEGLRG